MAYGRPGEVSVGQEKLPYNVSELISATSSQGVLGCDSEKMTNYELYILLKSQSRMGSFYGLSFYFAENIFECEKKKN